MTDMMWRGDTKLSQFKQNQILTPVLPREAQGGALHVWEDKILTFKIFTGAFNFFKHFKTKKDCISNEHKENEYLISTSTVCCCISCCLAFLSLKIVRE